jgi:hypothetical protein
VLSNALLGLARQNLAVPAPNFSGSMRLQTNPSRSFAAPGSFVSASINHQCPPLRGDPRTWGNNGRAVGDLHIVPASVPADVGRADEFCIKCVPSSFEAVLILACHFLLIPRIRHQSDMGFSNDKMGDDIEYGSQLKAEDTNAQGQTDAVFGEVVEGGPNYRSVCSHAAILT